MPKEFSFCVRFFLEFGNQKAIGFDGMALLQLWTHERDLQDGSSVEMNVNGLKPLFWVMDADTVEDFSKQKDPARENILRKWNSVCYSLDFGKVNQTCQVSWNGQLSNVKISTGNPWGRNYEMGKPGLNMTLGKYWNGPYFIGKIV